MRSVRTLVTISADDKRWLDEYSHAQRVSIAETVRRAVRQFRVQSRSKPFRKVLETTKGLWKGRHGDALKYVNQLRDEWER